MHIDVDEFVALRDFNDLKDLALQVITQDVPGVTLQWRVVRLQTGAQGPIPSHPRPLPRQCPRDGLQS
jgi:hypothetical protein